MGGFKTFLEVGTGCINFSFETLKELSNNNPVIVTHANFPPHGAGDSFALRKDGKSFSQPWANSFAFTMPRNAAFNGVTISK